MSEQFAEPGGPAWRAANEPIPFEHGGMVYPGFVAGWCGHRVAESEWRAGFRVCERCPEPDSDPTDCCPDTEEASAVGGETVEDAEKASES